MAINLGTKKKMRGRPKGSKTKPDSPRMLRAKIRRERLAREEAEKIAGLKKEIGASGVNLAVPVSDAAFIVSETKPLLDARPDTDIFGTVKLETERKIGGAAQMPETELNNENNKTNDFGTTDETSREDPMGTNLPPESENPPSQTKPEDHRGLATIIWDSCVGLFATFIGSFWLPRKKGDNLQAGEIPYDEREMVIEGICKYFASVGMMILTPLQELCVVVGAYCLPRLAQTFDAIRMRFMKKAKPAPPQPEVDPRMASKPATTPPEENGKPPGNPGLDSVAGDIIKQQS